MRFPIVSTVRLLHSAERSSLALAGFNLVVGLVFTVLLILNVKNTSYPTAVGVSLALLVGGGLTGLTVWASLCFGRGGQPEDARGGKDRRVGNDRES